MNIVDLGHMREAGPASANTYNRKLKRAIVPMGSIEALLSLKGDRSYRMEGWPEGGKIVGAEIMRNPFAVILHVYHPDFPSLPVGEMPGLIKIDAVAVV